MGHHPFNDLRSEEKQRTQFFTNIQFTRKPRAEYNVHYHMNMAERLVPYVAHPWKSRDIFDNFFEIQETEMKHKEQAV